MLQRGCVTVLSSLLMPNTALRRVLLYTGVIKHSVVSGAQLPVTMESIQLVEIMLLLYVNFL